MKNILNVCFSFSVLAICRPSVEGSTECSSSSSTPTEIVLSGGEIKFIASPNYPSPYPESFQTCYYRVTAPAGQKVSYRFATDFSLEVNFWFHCLSDFVELFDSSTTSNSLGIYCGDNIPPAGTSTGRYLVIKFHHDHANSYKGFRAGFKEGSIPPTEEEVPPLTKIFGPEEIVGIAVSQLIVIGVVVGVISCSIYKKCKSRSPTPARNQVATIRTETSVIPKQRRDTMPRGPPPYSEIDSSSDSARYAPPAHSGRSTPPPAYQPPEVNAAYPPPPSQLYPPEPPPAYNYS